MLKRYDVDHPHRERGEFPGLLDIGIGFKGVAPARTLTHARILPAADKHKPITSRRYRPPPEKRDHIIRRSP